jgi:pilus assembly protein Flp/PilA
MILGDALEGAMQSVVQFLNDESGATAIEYALIAAMIGIVVITALVAAGNAITGKFFYIENAITTATGS